LRDTKRQGVPPDPGLKTRVTGRKEQCPTSKVEAFFGAEGGVSDRRALEKRKAPNRGGSGRKGFQRLNPIYLKEV